MLNARPGVELRYGAFITSVINFLIMAFVLFCLLKAVNKLTALGKKPEAPAAPTTKVVPVLLQRDSDQGRQVRALRFRSAERIMESGE